MFTVLSSLQLKAGHYRWKCGAGVFHYLSSLFVLVFIYSSAVLAPVPTSESHIVLAGAWNDMEPLKKHEERKKTFSCAQEMTVCHAHKERKSFLNVSLWAP